MGDCQSVKCESNILQKFTLQFVTFLDISLMNIDVKTLNNILANQIQKMH